MSSSRLTLALGAGSLIITNMEKSSVALPLLSGVRHIRPGQTINMTKVFSIPDIRKSPILIDILSKRRIFIHKTWK